MASTETQPATAPTPGTAAKRSKSFSLRPRVENTHIPKPRLVVAGVRAAYVWAAHAQSDIEAAAQHQDIHDRSERARDPDTNLSIP